MGILCEELVKHAKIEGLHTVTCDRRCTLGVQSHAIKAAEQETL